MTGRRARGRNTAAASALLATLWAAGAARAATGGEAPRRVAMEAGACPAVSAPALRRIVAIEIGDLLLGSTELVSGDTDRVTITCAGAVARVRADGPGRPHALERTLRLDDFPGDAAPRALALAAIEILAALSPDVRERIEARQKPPAPPPAPVVVVAPPPTPPAPRPSTILVGGATYRMFLGSPGASAWGGRLGVRQAFGGRWHVGLDGELARGRTAAAPSLGDVELTLASLGVFAGVQADAGSHLAGGLLLGGRGGAARLAGQPLDPAASTGASVARPWGGPMAGAWARARVGRVGLEVGAEVGFDVSRAAATADGATVVSVGGPWLAVLAGLGVELR